MLNEHDIATKTFRTKLGGYNKASVDKFMHHICQVYKSCSSQKTFKQLRNRLANTGFNTQFLGYDRKEVTHFIRSVRNDLANPTTIKMLCEQNKSHHSNLITPKQIRKTTFSIKKHGYSINQVNSFFDRINKSYCTVLKENKRLKTKLNNRH